MREYFNARGYIEVETPILQSIPGGAAARPFITHHNALDINLYLRIANELYLKRLIVGGFEGVYEFSKNFRNEGMDRTHNPEFTCMEIYVAYKDYHWMMEFTEQMLEKICLDVNGTKEITVGDKTIRFKAPFRRVTMIEAIHEHTGIDITGMNEAQLREMCKQLNIEIDETMGKGKLIDEIFGEKCEGNYIQPTFITDYPIEMSPLCKRHRNNPDLTERFELIVNGKELCNAYSELNDPIDQLERFQEQLRLSEKGDDEAMFIDMDFVRALEYGMPPTSGMGPAGDVDDRADDDSGSAVLPPNASGEDREERRARKICSARNTGRMGAGHTESRLCNGRDAGWCQPAIVETIAFRVEQEIPSRSGTTCVTNGRSMDSICYGALKTNHQ